MDISPPALIRNVLPALPSIIITIVLACLGWTANSSNQDVLTQIIVAAARPILRTPAKIGRSQRVWVWVGTWSAWITDLAVRAGLGWLVGMDGVQVEKRLIKIVGVRGDDVVGEKENGQKVLGVFEAVEWAFKRLGDHKHGIVACPQAEVKDVEVEWTIYQRDDQRASQSLSSPRPSTQKPVILYLHGGAHCLMDPTTHRWTTSTLSKLCQADVCNVRFRLSPQYPFPAALIDVFVAYLYLLAPTDNSQPPIQPSQIVLAGDSSGGGLSASLLLLLLTISRAEIKIKFNDSTLQIPSPPCAGLALTSPWLDTTRSLPSTSANAKWDIIAPPPLDSASPPFPADEIWPAHPPRAETYCTAEICTHPLVSPLAASSQQWKRAPPVWVCSGWEGFVDEIEVFARKVYQSSSDRVVHFQGWEGMPHCFGMMPWNWAGWEAMNSWAKFCKGVVDGRVEKRECASWTKTVGKDKGLRRLVKIDELGSEVGGIGYVRDVALTDDVVERLMSEGRRWRIGLEYEMVKKWKAGVSS